MSVAAGLRLAASSHELKTLFDRKIEAIRMLEPCDLALETARAHVRLAYGLACDVEHEDRAVRVDLPTAHGGGATGPHPGQLMRASLGACLAMGYRIWAARLEVPLDDVWLDVVCEYDPRGQLGVEASAPVGWIRVVFDVVIRSPAPDGDVRRVVETAHRLSPMLANLSRDVERVFRVRVVPSEGNESGPETVPHGGQ